MKRRTNRRDFLKQTTAAGVGFWVAGGVALADKKPAANDRVNIACIGVGGKGSSDTSQAGALGNIVALCDIDDNFLNSKAQSFPNAKKYNDFRKMFDEMGKEIDAVTVSTPDHTHAPASIMAMKLKKHVYCQKPLTHTVYEARRMRDVAREMKVATQMGNQGSAADGLRRAVELIQSGIIGKVTEAHVWTNRPVWPQAPKVTARPAKSDPVPPHVHWEEWLGPAPFRPYVGNRTYHDFNWRGWWDFGTGALGDMACHTANLAFRSLNLGHPTSVVAEAGDVNPETYPSWATVHFEFPARGDMPPVRFTWYEGHRNGRTVVPPGELVKGQRKAGADISIYYEDGKYYFAKGSNKPKDVTSGCFLVGETGILFSPDDYGTESYILRDSGIEQVKGKPEKLASNHGGDGGMKAEWIKAMQGGPAPYSSFDFAAMLTETILLGNIAIKAGKRLEWDGPGLKFTNDSSANQHLHYEYRKGWTL
jgi:predicted dehydrogenase